MDDDFYLAFEDRFRGSRELIISRLHVYLPFILPLRCHLAVATAVDLGCGRGEWLELIQEHGVSGQGADVNSSMVAVCQGRGLRVHDIDAIEFLRSLPDGSQTVISGFHIAEHLPFAALQDLTSEAMRALQPGGVLILETPNSENLCVGASSFYLDPSHRSPIPPQLLAFLCEHAGFKRAKILRLQESEELMDQREPGLIDVLRGVSPDYGVVSQKDGPPELLDALEPAFEKDYGISLDELARRYQSNIRQLAQRLEKIGAEAAEIGRITSPLREHDVVGAICQGRKEIAQLKAEMVRIQADLASYRQELAEAKEAATGLIGRLTAHTSTRPVGMMLARLQRMIARR
jgi:O-antigen chain-terminating methyltransferase